MSDGYYRPEMENELIAQKNMNTEITILQCTTSKHTVQPYLASM